MWAKHNLSGLFVGLLLLIGPRSSAQDSFKRDAAGQYMMGLAKVSPAKPNGFMTERELAVLDILNSIRRYPQAAAAFLAQQYGTSMSDNQSSLYHTLLQASPDTAWLVFDKALYQSAACHALSAGQAGYRGHDCLKASGCTAYFFGECISFGFADPLAIVLQLLIDEGVPSLGHRKICLNLAYRTIGLAIRPHQSYQYNAVIDFGFE